MTEVSHHSDSAARPSGWVTRFAPLVEQGGSILDVAAGGGRNARHFLECGHLVVAIDRSTEGLADLTNHAGAEIVAADLEDGSPWPLGDRRFAAVVVTNYLYRPLLATLVDAVAPRGLLIYETFALGNGAFGRPRNPDFLLRPGELLEAVAGKLRVIAYEDILVDTPNPAAIQRICARREA